MMKMRTVLATLVLVSAYAAGEARASFTYSVAPATTSYNFGGSTLTVGAFNGGAVSPLLSGTQGINVAQISQSSTTAPPATDAGSFALPPLVVTINNQNGGGTGTFTVNGTIVVTRSDTAGAASTFTPGSITPATLTLGIYLYTLSAPSYSQPTIGSGGNGNGALGYTLTETQIIPEPSSMLLGLLGLPALVVFRRRTVKA